MKSDLVSMPALALGGLLVIGGCATSHPSTATPSPAATPNSAVSLLANGRSIFQTGKDLAGVQIGARTKPLFPTCVACHGPNGAGNKHLKGGAVSADLRRAALVGAQKHPYTIALLERAISRGIDNEGKTLDPVMPRWELSKRDLRAVAEYVATLK
ncbi:MAG: cytochrome c [Candidatus Baltobacteraceae bacterium]